MKKLFVSLATLITAVVISCLLLFSNIHVSDAATSILGFISFILFSISIAQFSKNQ